MFTTRLSVAAVAVVALLAGCQSDGGEGGGVAADRTSPAAADATSAPPAGGSAAKADVCAKAKKAMDEGKAELLGMMFASEGAEPSGEAIGAVMVEVADGLRDAAATAADADVRSAIDEVAAGFAQAGEASDPVAESDKIIPQLEERLKETCG